jgi:transposase
LTAESGFDSELSFGGSLGRADWFDEGWAVIGPLLPAERGRGCRPAQDNRRYFEGMMWMARTGAQRRHLPDEYGKWNSGFRRYRRWVETGVFEAMLETLAEMVERDRSAAMIDSTIVRAHHCAVGIKWGLRRPRRLADRAVASPPTSIPAAMRRDGRSVSC